MKIKLVIIPIIFFLAGLTLLIYKNFNFQKKILQQNEKNIIGVTIMPLLEITKDISKDKYEVELILPPGADVHAFEIGPNELEKIKKMKLIFYVDLGLDDWLIKNLHESQVKMVNLSQEIEPIITSKGTDPHFWFSIENMKRISHRIESEMEILDPANKNLYQENLNHLLARFDDLTKEKENMLKEIKQKNLIVQHDAFNYLAKETGLNIVAYLEDSHGETSFYNLQELIRKINNLKIKQIFKVAGEESNLLNNLAQELNLKIYELDPMEGKKSLSYFEAYLNNLKVLKEALKQ